MQEIIKLKNLSKTFYTKDGEVKALQNVTLSVRKGEIYGIIGLSGAGKSTLVRCINLLERPTAGELYVNGEDFLSLSASEVRERRKKIGMIFQHFNLLMQRNVLDNVAFPMEVAGIKKKEARKKAVEYLEVVGLSGKAKAYPAQLSGGQQQRVAIARVLASKPEILLCDEATSALDPQNTKSILSLVKDINEKYGLTVVVITHEMSVIQDICSRVAVLDHGKLVEEETVEELFRNPKTKEAQKLVLSTSAHARRMYSERMIRLTFHGKSAYEPIISNIVLEMKTPLNILYADTQTVGGNAEGEMILQVPDDQVKADKIIAYFKSKGLGVEEVQNVDITRNTYDH